MTTTIIYGPAGSGKTRHAERLKKAFDCDVIVDEWDGISDLPENALALTQRRAVMVEWPRAYYIDSLVVQRALTKLVLAQ